MKYATDGDLIATTKVSIPRSADDITWQWQGGDIIGISRELLADAIDGVFSTRDPQIDEEFTVGPYRVRCIDADRRTVLARRIEAQL